MAESPKPVAARQADRPPAAAMAAKAANARPRLTDAQEFSRIMWYGDPGTGKTDDMAQAAELGLVVYIDAEKRLKPKTLAARGITTDNIEPRFTTDKEPLTFEGLLEFADEMAERIQTEKIFAIAWDSATETHRMLLERNVDRAALRAAVKGEHRDIFKTFQDDYGDMTEQMRRIIRRLRDLPCHLLISCLPKRDTAEGGEIRVAPALTPAVLRDFMGYMDVVVNTRVESVGDTEEYSGLTRPVGRFEAKDSYGLLPRILVDPSFPRILDYVQGGLKAADDPVQQQAKARRLAVSQAQPAAAAS